MNSSPKGILAAAPAAPIGFVLLTHTSPGQTLSLCARLSAVFDSPPIALHHDFGQSPLDTARLPANVHLVQDWIPTRWGHFSVIDAMFRALTLLRRHADPEWVVSLSNADYPIASAQTILTGLQRTSADVFIEHRLIALNPTPLPDDDPGRPGRSVQWKDQAIGRYLEQRLTPYRLADLIGMPGRALTSRSPLLIEWLTPFRKGVQCYGGDAWYTANRRTISLFLTPSPLRSALMKHLRRRSLPEEAFYHTLLKNTPGFVVEDRNLRYIDWSGGGKHPKTLGYQDIPALISSGAHFARKFPMDSDLFHAIDEAVAAREGQQTPTPISASNL